MNKSYKPKKYFIFGMKRLILNENKILAKQYTPSIREIMLDYIEIQNDYTKNSLNLNLRKSRNNYIDALKHYIENSILYKSSVLSNDLNKLVELINKKVDDSDEDLKFRRIATTIGTILKKIDKLDIYQDIIERIKESKNFQTVDLALECFVGELIFDGFSLNYIDDWFNKNVNPKEITEGNIDSYLDKMKELIVDVQRFEYYVNIYDNPFIEEERKLIDKKMWIQKYDEERDALTEKSIKYLQNPSKYSLYRVEIEARDQYAGHEKIQESIRNYFNLVSFAFSINDDITTNKIICKLPNGDQIKLRNENPDEKILFSGVENREQEDIHDFMIYRDRSFKENIENSELGNIQRALNIVKNQMNQSKENKVINLWSVIEYLLTFHEGKSIIGKVKDIIPKLICMYYIKDKLNIFWHRLLKYSDREDKEFVKEMIAKCRKDETDKYDIIKLTEFIKTTGKILIDELEFDDILAREIATIGMFFVNKENRMRIIENRRIQVESDLIRIYRTRNTLIHSGYRTETNLDLKAVRLYQYNNSLLGVIIYYKNKNTSTTITEILNSVVFTFEEYYKILEQKNPDLSELCKPKYMFL